MLLAQASLSAEDQIDDLVVKIDGKDEVFTVIRDFYQKGQWYYIPDRPRLAVHGDSPQFSLIKYQTKDPQHPQEELTGGVLQFSIKLSLPPKAIDSLKTAIAAKLNAKAEKENDKKRYSSTDINLGPIRFNSSKVALYELEKGLRVADANQDPGIGATCATQEIPFQLNLTSLGAQITEAITKKDGGIPVLVTYDYYTVTPPCGFKIEVNWETTYKHFSTDFKARCKLKLMNYAKLDTSIGIGLVKDLIKSVGSIKVTAISGPAFTDADIDKIMLPLLTRLANELFENTQAPPLADPAKTKDAPANSWFHNLLNPQEVNVNESDVAFKLVDLSKKGKETIELTKQSILERTSACGGLIGIGDYSEDIQKSLIEFIPGNWPSAYFNLPSVGDDESLGISSTDLSVQIVGKDGQQIIGAPPMQSATWRKATGQWEAQGKARTALLFPMAYLYDKFDKRVNELNFKTTVNITYNRKRMTFTNLQPVFDGAKAVAENLDYVDLVTIYGSKLGFPGDDSTGKLQMVDIAVTNNSKTDSEQVVEQTQNKFPLYFMVAKPTETKTSPVNLKINFKLNDGKTVPWNLNSENDIRKTHPSLAFFLNRQDWDK